MDTTGGVRIGKNNKKEVSFPEKEVREYGLKIIVDDGSTTPKQSACHYDYQLKATRALVSCSIAAYDKSLHSDERPMQCMEAFPSCGTSGLLWGKHLSSSLTKFHLNCSHNDKAAARMQKNLELNGMEGKVNLIHCDPFSLNNDHSYFNFVYLEAFANCAQYLDAIFRRMPRRSMIAISTVDDPSLYSKTPEVAERLYGGMLGKTKYYKELGARLILAAVARSAARANIGIRVLWCYCIKSCLSFLVQIDKGPAKANESLKNVKSLIHCNICENRTFYPDTNYVDENPYCLLTCSCNTKMPGKTAINIGPVWSGDLFDTNFLQKMELESTNFPWNNDVHDIFEHLIEEGLCSSVENPPPEQKDSDTPSEVPVGNKKIRLQAENDQAPAPPFYFNLHSNQPKDSKMIKADKVVTLLRSNGFRASRTHFDREAVKTNAFAEELMHIIKTGMPASDKE